MGEASKIGWTDHTFNPWQGCEKVSEACDHCFAESIAKRVGHAERWGHDGARDVTTDGYWRNPLKWDKAAGEAGRPALVFCGSMCDVFEDRRDLDATRARLWDLIAATPNLTWLLLTKRPEHVADLVPADWTGLGFAEHPERLWPRNVWMGTTIEHAAAAVARIPHLLALPAPVRFLSCEPLLGYLSIFGDLPDGLGPSPCDGEIHWVIAGGESGPGHRPLDIDYARDLRDQADAAGVPFFFKQHGGQHPGSGGHLLDGELRYAWPASAGDRSDVIAAALAAEIDEAPVSIERSR